MSSEDESIKILRQRYAKGEITKKQYLEMKQELVEENENEDKRVVDKNNNPNKNEQPKKGSSAKTIIGIVVVLAVIGIFLLLITSSHTNSNNGSSQSSSNPLAVLEPPATVTVSGAASASGQGTSISQVVFTGSNGASYPAAVSGEQYTVSLPNPGTYNIQETWSGQYSWQGGNVNAGSYSLSQGTGASSSVQYNLPGVSTPDSVIQVSGSVSTGFSTTPTGLNFTNTNGQTITVAVSGGSDYSSQLPNLIGYNVQVLYRNVYGGAQACNAGSLSLSEGVGVSTVSQNWQC